MVLPSRHSSGSIEPHLEVVKADGPIVVVVEIVFARPQQFHRDSNFLCDRRCFQHVIVGKAPAKSASCTAQVYSDLALVNFQQLRYLPAASRRSLARRPELDLSILI